MNKTTFSLLLITYLIISTTSAQTSSQQINQSGVNQSFRSVLAEGDVTPIWIKEYQNSVDLGGREYNHILINNSKYEAVRIGEYLWMNMNLRDSIPLFWDAPWKHGTGYVGLSSQLAMSQEFLDRDLDRLKVDKSQFQIDMEDFNTYYGGYYTRTEIEHFKRKNEKYVSNAQNLNVYETAAKIQTNWKVPFTRDFRQLFAMCPVPDNEILGQIAVRITLSYKKNENPLAYDIYDPAGGVVHRTYWFEYSTNALGFNLMPGGSRLPAAGPIDNGLGPNNGKWDGIRGDIYHLFHTAKYLTADSQVDIHDYLSTGHAPSYHWYNVRFCRELTDEELGYKLYINQKDYEESYEYTIVKLNPHKVKIIKLGLNEVPPVGYYELPKGYLRGFYVQYILNKSNPKTVTKIVEYLKQVDDELFFKDGEFVPYDPDDYDKDEELVVDGQSKLQVYPIPVETTLNVNLDSDEDKIYSIRIFNFWGVLLHRKDDLEKFNQLDVSFLPVGLHVLVVNTSKGTSSYKIVKK